jgi:hypothetical protein
MSKARNLATLLSSDGSVKTTKYADSVGGQSDFVASGTLPNGVPVILKTDGTVESIYVTGVTENIPAGSASLFNSGSSSWNDVAFDPNTADTFVVAYADASNSSYGTAVVGTISGTTLSFGTEYVFNSGTTTYTAVAFDPNNSNNFVVSYRDNSNSNYGTAIVGTVSGTTIGFGAEYLFNAGSTVYISMAFDPNTAGKFVISYKDNDNLDKGTAVVGTISGTTLSFGAETVFNAASTVYISMDFDSNTAGKFVVVFRDSANSNYGTAMVGTVSGTSVTFGAKVVFNTGTTEYIHLRFDPNTAGKFVVVYQDGGNSSYGTAIVGTVSGTAISFGTAIVFNSASVSQGTYIPKLSFDPSTTNKFVALYQDGGNSFRSTAIVGTVSGTSISFGAEHILTTAFDSYNSVSVDPNTAGRFVVVYADGASSSYGTAIVGQLTTTITNLTSTNFIGTSTAAYTNGQTATITVQGGLSTNQTGLTAGSTYYVQNDATLDTSAGNPSVEAGKALSATSILLKGI